MTDAVQMEEASLQLSYEDSLTQHCMQAGRQAGQDRCMQESDSIQNRGAKANTNEKPMRQIGLIITTQLSIQYNLFERYVHPSRHTNHRFDATIHTHY